MYIITSYNVTDNELYYCSSELYKDFTTAYNTALKMLKQAKNDPDNTLNYYQPIKTDGGIITGIIANYDYNDNVIINFIRVADDGRGALVNE